jgi:hypothetical protein
LHPALRLKLRQRLNKHSFNCLRLNIAVMRLYAVHDVVAFPVFSRKIGAYLYIRPFNSVVDSLSYIMQ